MNSAAIDTPTFAGSQLAGDASLDQPAEDVLDIHAVILTNYVRTHHVLAFQEFAKRVRKLTILLSVSMEPDREWDAQWGDLDVQTQRNFMWTTNWEHSSGFSEPNFIHVPIDTPWRLWKLKPDVVLSYEMGFRTLFSAGYRLLNRKAPVVMVGNMSQHIEQERGFLRRCLRKLIRRSVKYFTFNGPSCKRYLRSLGIRDDRLFHFPYCIDGASVYRGDRKVAEQGSPLRLLYCGSISERKGILQFAETLAQWCEANHGRNVELMIAGSGDLKEQVANHASETLSINFLGNCDTEQLREAYGLADICVFPTLADEWGLVPIEAMASGLPVLGSIHAQSVEACCVDSENGWTFDPDHREQVLDAIDRALSTPRTQMFEMGKAARDSVSHISAQTSGRLLAEAVAQIRTDRK